MENLNLLDVLISPDNGQTLHIDETDDQLVDHSGAYSYARVEGVPVLLPKNAQERFAKPEAFRQFDTSFYYVTHYQTDAEAFDYFEQPESAAELHENRRLHEAIIAETPGNTRRILDVGCGNAWVAGHFCPLGVSVFSMDISTVNPVKAIKKYPFDRHFGIVADVYALPFRESTFDCIIAAEIIEHVPDPAAFIRCLLKVLKPGGSLIVTTPYNEKIVYTLCIHCNRPTPLHAHLHAFTESKILDLLPADRRLKANAYAFSSKILSRLHTHILLQYLPYGVWRGIDKLVNRLLFKPGRLLLKVAK
mgnify:CR=1 FL=1